MGNTVAFLENTLGVGGWVTLHINGTQQEGRHGGNSLVWVSGGLGL